MLIRDDSITSGYSAGVGKIFRDEDMTFCPQVGNKAGTRESFVVLLPPQYTYLYIFYFLI